MIMKQTQLRSQLQSMLTKLFGGFMKQRFHRRSVFIFILLFILSLIFSPIIAYSQSSSDAVLLTSHLEVSQVSESNLIERAKSLYSQQQFEKAAEAWQEAVIFFTEQGEPLNQAIALSNLSLAYQKIGQWDEANQAITQSLFLLEQLPETPEKTQVYAQALDIKGSLELAKGNPKAALKAWEKAFEIYQNTGDLTGSNQNQINQVQALRVLGYYNRAEDVLEQMVKRLEIQPDSAEKAITFVSLGDIFRVMGKPKESQENLDKGKKLAKKLDFPEVQAAALISLGNLARSKIPFNTRESGKETQQSEQYQEAQNYYQKAVDVATSTTIKIKAQLNQLNLKVVTQDWTDINKLQANIREKLKQVPQNQATIYSKLNLVQSLMCFAEAGSSPDERKDFSPLLQPCFLTAEDAKSFEENNSISVSWEEIRNLTLEAVEDAEHLKNTHAQAYALGYLGATSQQERNFDQAEKYTREALKLKSISSYEAGEITYLLQWQLGRLKKAQKDTDIDPGRIYNIALQTQLESLPPEKNNAELDIIKIYDVAFKTLSSLRRDLLAISPDVRYSFRDSIEPLYREYVDLLLKREEPIQENLKQARQIIEALQLAEVNDFFQDACTEAIPQKIDSVVDNIKTPTTVIYPIVLEDRIEVILKLPGKDNLEHYRTTEEIQIEKFKQMIDEKFRANLSSNPNREKDRGEREKKKKEFLDYSSKIYEWLIRPAEDKQILSKDTTLVFVLDGSLRKIPMAALYDSVKKEYLIEKYAIALAPGLQLLSPKPFSEINLNVLLAGVGEGQTLKVRKKPFEPLPQVEQELNDLQALLSPNNPTLLNQDFSVSNLESQLDQTDLTVVHIATHGVFDSNLDDSYIVAWEKELTAREIDRILREQRSDQSVPIELLTLSACDTAEGDDRAILGIAGVAVRAGARSTIASLWKVNDSSTAEFMRLLYEELLTANEIGTVNKAKALQKVQLDFLTKYPDKDWKQPYYWAPFVLIGNWF